MHTQLDSERANLASLRTKLQSVEGEISRGSKSNDAGLKNRIHARFVGSFGVSPKIDSRTPMGQGGEGAKWLGRDHWPKAFSVWMAGGGIKKGFVYGASDEFWHSVAENPMHVHDLDATILHLFGINHEQLTYRFQGRNFRLTDVHGKVAYDIIA